MSVVRYQKSGGRGLLFLLLAVVFLAFFAWLYKEVAAR